MGTCPEREARKNNDGQTEEVRTRLKRIALWDSEVGETSSAKCHQLKTTCTCQNDPPAPSNTVVRVSRETKGRRGKGVTIISDVPLNADGLTELAATLKQRLGTGGTVKEGRIEIQGDHRDRIVQELEALGYQVKRAGG